MYTKDKTHRITLRLTEEQFNFVTGSADLYGVSPSDFLRMVISVTMAGQKSMVKTLQADENATIKEVTINAVNELKEDPYVKAITDRKETVTGRENDETDQHSLV